MPGKLAAPQIYSSGRASSTRGVSETERGVPFRRRLRMYREANLRGPKTSKCNEKCGCSKHRIGSGHRRRSVVVHCAAIFICKRSFGGFTIIISRAARPQARITRLDRWLRIVSYMIYKRGILDVRRPRKINGGSRLWSNPTLVAIGNT
jgi:hypothetical protein